MSKLLFSLSMAAMAACGQSGLTPPQLGFIAGTNHSLRPVLGFSGNLLLGSPAAEDVTSVSWSGAFGIVKTGSALLVFDNTHMLRSIDAPAGPALFAFRSNGSPALALLPQSGALYTWTGETFKLLSFRADLLGGPALAIAAPRFDGVTVIVQREDGLWKVDLSARGHLESQTALPGVHSPVLLESDGTLVYADLTALVLRDPSRAERRIELGITIGEIRWMGSGWLHVLEANDARQYAVRIAPGSEKISQLPEVR